MKIISKKKGFTLVEVIVVVCIILVFAGATVISLTFFIKQAHKSNSIKEASACLTAAQCIAVQKHAYGSEFNIDTDKKDTLELAQIDNQDSLLALSTDNNSTVNYMIFKSSNGYYVSYNNRTLSIIEPNDLKNINYFSYKEYMNEIYKCIQDSYGKSPTNKWYCKDSKNAQLLLTQLNYNKIFITELDITNWCINYNEKDTEIYWTKQNLDNYKNEDVVIMMSYSFITKEYNLKNLKIFKNNNKIIFSDNLNNNYYETEVFDNYEDMLKQYNSLLSM